MVWHLIKYWIVFPIAAFYKRIQGKNIPNLQVKGPVIIAMNHPNAFTDPIAFTMVTYPQRLKYLARGDAFKPGLAATLLEWIGIVPIYRLQDGGLEGLKKNDETYLRVNQLLKKNAKIIVFAEGICVQERRLRPLKKGVARMVFGAYEALNDERLVVVPVGVNYSKPYQFGSNLFYNVGEPIRVKEFMPQYRENPARANNLLLQTLEPKMRELITHIENKEYDEAVYHAEALSKKDLIRARNLDRRSLADDLVISQEITGKVNAAVKNDRALVDEFLSKSRPYFKILEKQQLKDWLINPNQNKSVTPLNLYLRFLLLGLGFPVYATGLLGNYPAYLLTKKLTKRVVKKQEFYSSFFIGISMVLFTLNYLLWFTLVYLFSPNLLLPLLVCTGFVLSAWFSLYYHTFMRKTLGMGRILKNSTLAKQLAEQRAELMVLLNKF